MYTYIYVYIYYIYTYYGGLLPGRGAPAGGPARLPCPPPFLCCNSISGCTLCSMSNRKFQIHISNPSPAPGPPGNETRPDTLVQTSGPDTLVQVELAPMYYLLSQPPADAQVVPNPYLQVVVAVVRQVPQAATLVVHALFAIPRVERIGGEQTVHRRGVPCRNRLDFY